MAVAVVAFQARPLGHPVILEVVVVEAWPSTSLVAAAAQQREQQVGIGSCVRVRRNHWNDPVVQFLQEDFDNDGYAV